MNLVAIVCAYNEAPRVAAVIQPLLASRVFDRVIVVDDGSRDGTSEVAMRAGASALTLNPNRGKGGAMLAGVQATSSDVVGFFDADLVGLRPDHVHRMVDAMHADVSMVCGLRDYGQWNQLQFALPPITGERLVRRSVLEKVPVNFWSGFRIEAAINEMAAREGRIERLVLDDLAMIPKWHKVGPKKGIEDATKMMVEVLKALAEAERIPR